MFVESSRQFSPAVLHLLPAPLRIYVVFSVVLWLFQGLNFLRMKGTALRDAGRFRYDSGMVGEGGK
jgi:hypothetical protein